VVDVELDTLTLVELVVLAVVVVQAQLVGLVTLQQ